MQEKRLWFLVSCFCREILDLWFPFLLIWLPFLTRCLQSILLISFRHRRWWVRWCQITIVWLKQLFCCPLFPSKYNSTTQLMVNTRVDLFAESVFCILFDWILLSKGLKLLWNESLRSIFYLENARDMYTFYNSYHI